MGRRGMQATQSFHEQHVFGLAHDQ
jgi:hypothetical protein